MVSRSARNLLWLVSTIAVLVLLFSYHTSTGGIVSRAGEVAVISGTRSTTRASGQTVEGPSVLTRYGPIQVQVIHDGSTIAAVNVIDYPNSDHRDQEINGYALPILVDETLAAQDADVDMVSGATYTSEGYRQSLQAALDEAGL